MAFKNPFTRTQTKENTAQPPPGKQTAASILENTEAGLFKAYAPDYLYNPPYGRPRKDDVILLRNLCKNAYVQSIVWTMGDEVAHTEYEIGYKKQYIKEGKPTIDKQADIDAITTFFDNPNGNDESFNLILKKTVTDILEMEAGVWNKVFDGKGKFQQLFAIDGATILKNPDQYGYYGNRDELVPWFSFQWDETSHQYFKVPVFKDAKDLDRYSMKDRAAYFQYGNYIGFPVPFGRREIVYISRNPRTDSTYARPPAAILGDVLYTLLYGSSYNNAFYVNNNVPDGVISIMNANANEIEAFKEQFYNTYRVKDTYGNRVKQFFKMPFTNTEVKFTPFLLDPAVMQILEQQGWFIKLVWACFGVTPDEMGFTDSTGSKNVSNQQSNIVKRKSIEPLLRLLEYHINTQVMSEFNCPELEFKFHERDLDDDLKKYQLYQLQLSTNMATVNELRSREGLAPLADGDKTASEKQADQFQQGLEAKPSPFGGKAEEKSAPASVKPEETAIKEPLIDFYDEAGKEITALIRTLDNETLSKVG
jgi:hypothetical protein